VNSFGPAPFNPLYNVGTIVALGTAFRKATFQNFDYSRDEFDLKFHYFVDETPARMLGIDIQVNRQRQRIHQEHI